jgi:hypothetical protein
MHFWHWRKKVWQSMLNYVKLLSASSLLSILILITQTIYFVWNSRVVPFVFPRRVIYRLTDIPRKYIAKTLKNHVSNSSVAKWLAHLPFTSEAAGSNLTKYFLNATRAQSACEKSKSQRSAESRGFSPGTPVSSHRESWQGGLGKKGPQ